MIFNKDRAEESAHVMIIVNNRWIRKEQTSLHILLVLADKDREVKLHELVDRGATNQFIQKRLVERMGLVQHMRSLSMQGMLRRGRYILFAVKSMCQDE